MKPEEEKQEKWQAQLLRDKKLVIIKERVEALKADVCNLAKLSLKE